MRFLSLDNLKDRLTEIPLSSPDYPVEWRGEGAPQTLYALGDSSLLKARKFAIVGSRTTPPNALKLGAQIAKALSSQFVILTGVADGGDGAAIEGALIGSGRVICLLAGGFSALPQASLSLLERVVERGLLLSYQPFETPVRSFSYEKRNELLAKLCEGVFVLGAGEKSGALITAKYAKKQGKPIFAIPYPPNSASGSGCNALIKAGAFLTESERDIAARYGIDLREEQKAVVLSENEERVYAALKELLSARVDELAAKAALPPYKMRGILSALEIKGLIVAVGGNRFTIV